MTLTESLNDSFDSLDDEALIIRRKKREQEARRTKHQQEQEQENAVNTTANNSCSSQVNTSTPIKTKSPRPRSSNRRMLSWRRDDGGAGEENDISSEKENTTNSESRRSSSNRHHHRSPGVSPSKFHQKIFSDPKQEQIALHWKERIEESLLTQEKLQHKETLETQRKAFRKLTTLKTWPLQDMAMEHLDYLFNQNGDSTSSIFHGGDYLSSESSSSTGSSGQGGKRRNPSSPLKGSSQSSTPIGFEDTMDHTEPLWNPEPRIFATEKAQGKRKYLVGHFGRIADWYWRKSVMKHLYEVIREKTPCRLYFDLEFPKEYNEGVNEDALLEEFYLELAAEFREYYGVILLRSQIIDLDSSSDQKFSRHWIIDLDDEGLFEDGPTAGRFVKRLVSRLAEEQGTNELHSRRPTLAKHLFVNTRESQKTSCFIDLGVYTRNRLFRCYGSSKFGKTHTLKAASSNQYPLISLPTNSDLKSEEDEGDSLTDSATPKSSSSSLEEYIVANDWKPHAKILASTLVIPLGGSKGKRIFRVDDEDCVVRPPGSERNTSYPRKYNAAISIHSEKSPIPTLEKFVLEVLACRGGGPQGAIRAWSIEYGGPRTDIPVSITFQMCRNRYCELIGRPHKSNNIFWTVIFESWTCIQGCHDPDCHGRGSPIPIRQDYMESILEEYQIWRDEDFEKALMALNLDDLASSSRRPVEDSAGLHVQKNENPSNGVVDGGDNDDESTEGSFLSDEALLQAIEANPELFP